jgi:hypothetical protein
MIEVRKGNDHSAKQNQRVMGIPGLLRNYHNWFVRGHRSPHGHCQACYLRALSIVILYAVFLIRQENKVRPQLE